MLSGTIADLRYTTHRTWGMQGECFSLQFSGMISTMSRNYVTQDVLRRIMTDYFGYDVHFVMNITDIDDKVYVPICDLRQSANFPSLTDYTSRATNVSGR